jgi:hypothetical protein
MSMFTRLLKDLYNITLHIPLHLPILNPDHKIDHFHFILFLQEDKGYVFQF